jgi:hypothetical protein
MDWQQNMITDSAGIRDLLQQSKRIAVLGMRPETHSDRPAFFVPAYLASIGLDVVPVPVVNRDVSTILGRQVYHALADIPGPVDIVDVFRRSEDIPAHVDDILAKQPRAVWFQSGIRNDQVAEQLAKAGIKVVQDRCLMVEYRQISVSG